LFAITLHEAAHGYTAYLFGDDTAYVNGRVSLNPLQHIDPIGTLLVPVLLYFATNGNFLFGYAKPVPVAFHRLRNPRWHSLWVALAGPGANFVMAFAWTCLFIVLALLRVEEPFFTQMARAGVMVNLAMCAFNLFPLLPLDGGRIVSAFLPPRFAYSFNRLEPYGFFIVMGLVLIGIISNLWMRPLMMLLSWVINFLLTPLYFLFS
jgi:Zn-dependent protease